MANHLSQELWRNFYARMFALALCEQNPDRRQAYIDAISNLVDLSKSRKERNGRRRS